MVNIPRPHPLPPLRLLKFVLLLEQIGGEGDKKKEGLTPLLNTPWIITIFPKRGV
jgi:hypothetical protein